MSMTSDVVRPHWGWFVLLDGGVAVLLAVTLSEQVYESVPVLGPLRLPERRALHWLVAGTAAVHVVEAAVAAGLASRRGLPVRSWTLQTFVVGFPSLLALRRVAMGEET
jgi:hypothetical protein